MSSTVSLNSEEMDVLELAASQHAEAGQLWHRYTADAQTPIDLFDLPFDDEPIMSRMARGYVYALGRRGDDLVLYTAGIQSVRIVVWSKTALTANATALDIKDKFTREMPKDTDDRVRMQTWYSSTYGATRRDKLVDVMPVGSIRQNYSTAVNDHIMRLEALGDPTDIPGRIIILHGEPGTGKTTLIRALASSWRDWASFRIILDPDVMFHSVGYMLEAISTGGEGDDSIESPRQRLRDMIAGHSSSEPREEEKPRRPKWAVVVMEDSGGLLVRSRSGDQGLARLLNMADGIVGQGNRVLFLITTNEKFGELDPAIARPGRCLANLEIGALPQKEASAWLGRPVSGAKTLADLYAMKHENPALKPDTADTHGQYL